ncbi:hypothetical protein NDU88_005249 [Pleurodeles waltl]|uniref:Uncharacterized protein n=1 Tax=Pleurodeles waltl TaxID=8319 RepID=A0AAV7LM55_PLEWA|nr:hypothetical protein NDU88_005249 [Pleurodeles waltl]
MMNKDVINCLNLSPAPKKNILPCAQLHRGSTDKPPHEKKPHRAGPHDKEERKNLPIRSCSAPRLFSRERAPAKSVPHISRSAAAEKQQQRQSGFRNVVLGVPTLQAQPDAALRFRRLPSDGELAAQSANWPPCSPVGVSKT